MLQLCIFCSLTILTHKRKRNAMLQGLLIMQRTPVYKISCSFVSSGCISAMQAKVHGVKR